MFISSHSAISWILEPRLKVLISIALDCCDWKGTWHGYLHSTVYWRKPERMLEKNLGFLLIDSFSNDLCRRLYGSNMQWPGLLPRCHMRLRHWLDGSELWEAQWSFVSVSSWLLRTRSLQRWPWQMRMPFQMDWKGLQHQ